MARERVVIDTNVFLSCLLSSNSTPARAVERAVAHDRILASTDTLRELAEKLLSPKFDRYFSRERRMALLDRLAPNVERVETIQRVRASRDPRDDVFLEVAVNGSASLIVTGDLDLLALHPFRRIDILNPPTASPANPDEPGWTPASTTPTPRYSSPRKARYRRVAKKVFSAASDA